MIGSCCESLILAERYDDAYDGLSEATGIADGLAEDESTSVPVLHLMIQLQRETARVHRGRGESRQAKAANDRADEYRKRLPPPPVR